MFDLDDYLRALIPGCRTAFGDRLRYVGLQGSYLRGEAHESSDIDVMVVLDRLSVRDMDVYRAAIAIFMRTGRETLLNCAVPANARSSSSRTCTIWKAAGLFSQRRR